MVYNWLNIIRQQIYPAVCVLCGSKGMNDLDLCPSCREHLPRNLQPCMRCALPLPAGSNNLMCGQCAIHAPVFQRIQAPFLYQLPMDHLVQGLKFHQQFAYSRLLGQLLAEHLLSHDYNPPELILPVPLHPRQLRERGFNQSAELARQLSGNLKLDWSTRLLHKTRHTLPQHGLDKRHRVKNLRGCFRFDNPQGLTHVSVVDDVVTTGSTASEIARTLKQQGVKTVEIWALARTP